MPDLRFYTQKDPISVYDAFVAAGIADSVDKVVYEGHTDLKIKTVASIDNADLAEAAVFCTSKDSLQKISGRSFGVCFTTVPLKPKIEGDGLVIDCASPQLAFARLARYLHQSIEEEVRSGWAQGKDSIANVHKHADIHPSAYIGGGAVVEAGAEIGPFCYIGSGCVVSENARLQANVTLTHAIVGARTQILSGARIGQAGFGFVEGPEGLVRIPQLGRVLFGEDVEIGANTTIDRGALDDTKIGDRTKIDNLVQIGHNVRLGRNCVIAAHTGISGSCDIGDGVMMGGQVGMADHVKIGDGAQLAARSGLMRDVPAGAIMGGAPARPIKDWLRETATLTKLAKDKNR